MTNRSMISNNAEKQADVSQPGMMGDGTEEQNRGERGNPAARIEADDVNGAFGKQHPKK
jgi:hypothetical protein